MKTSLLTSLFVLLSVALAAQCNDAKYSVCISGFANEAIYPETHSISFGLEEYFEENDKGIRQLVTIDQTLATLKDSLKSFGLADARLVIMNVSSVNPQNYTSIQGTKEIMRHVFMVKDVKLELDVLLDMINNLRLKGLNGIFIRQDFSQNTELENQLCESAIVNATVNADKIFKLLGLERGSVVNVDVTNKSLIEGGSWEMAYQLVFNQYLFWMSPKIVSCTVAMTFEIPQVAAKE